MGCDSSKTVRMTADSTDNINVDNPQANYTNNVQNNNIEQTEKVRQLTDEEMRVKVNRYIKIDKNIHEWESKNLPTALQAKKEHAYGIAQALKDLEVKYKEACENVVKEKADVDKMQHPSVKAFFKSQQEYNEKMSKEQEEYLEALSQQEIVKKQLEGVQIQARISDKEVQEMTKEMQKLVLLYDEQDQILDDIFSGKYGSSLENKLEMEVDELLDRKERIGVARCKWMNGQMLLQHAYNQLGFAVTRWQSLAQALGNNLQVKYQLATETRNNLIAASQNITNAKRYLNNIKFPYLEPEEIATLDKACGNIYIDMQSPDRHQHALQCYSITHRRASALLQWFDNVIKNTIEKDLAKAKADLAVKQTDLRKERLRLMNEKMGGNSNDVKISDKERFSTSDLDVFDEFDDDDQLEPELVAISKPERVEGEVRYHCLLSLCVII